LDFDCGLKQQPERQKEKGKRKKIPTSVMLQGVEHPLPTFAFYLLPFAFFLSPLPCATMTTWSNSYAHAPGIPRHADPKPAKCQQKTKS
jgi:hypothetical protein